MLHINLLIPPPDLPPPYDRPTGWQAWGRSGGRVSWLIAFLAFVAGIALWELPEALPILSRVDRTFQDFLIRLAKLPSYPPVAVTLVEMEDAKNWTALEYSLFLKALPQQDPPVVLLTSVPAPGQTAFDRAFQSLAIRQPRLVLPVELTEAGEPDEAASWWLQGWPAASDAAPLAPFGGIVSTLPETLRGTVAVGVVNPPKPPALAAEAPLYFAFGQKYVPSLALRAAMLVRRVTPAQMQSQDGLLLGSQRLQTDERAAIDVDFSLLPGMRRLASSDLLLSLADAATASQLRIDPALLHGVLVLGDFSAAARTLPVGDGNKVTPAEWVAATVATLCNGPLLAPIDPIYLIGFLFFCAFAPLIIVQCRGRFICIGCFLLALVCVVADFFLARDLSLAGPFALPVFVLFVGCFFHFMVSFLPRYHS